MTPPMLVRPDDDDMNELFENALAGYQVVNKKAIMKSIVHN